MRADGGMLVFLIVTWIHNGMVRILEPVPITTKKCGGFDQPLFHDKASVYVA